MANANSLRVITKRMLHALLFCLSPEGFWGLPALLWGPPGVGKTSFVKATTRDVSLNFYRLSPAEHGEGAFGVVPVPGDDGRLHYPAPEWVAKFDDGGLLFVDEINTAGPAIQAPLLGLVQLRTLGGHTFGARTRILAAANETDDAAGGWDLARSLDNRFGHYAFEGLDVDDYIQALMTGFDRNQGATLDAKVEEERVTTLWPDANAWARGRIAGFLHRQRDHLHRKPEKSDPSRAYPTHRTWEYASVLLAASQIHSLTPIERDGLMTGFVGAGPVSQFARWESEADLGDPVAIVDGTEKFKHDQRRLDRSLAVLSSCASVVVNTKDAKQRTERAKRCWEILGVVSEQSTSAVFVAAVQLARSGIVTGPAAAKALEALYPTLQAAGVHVKR